MKHLRYLWYVIKHKWYVFVECCKLGIPLLGIIHDTSKFFPSEWKSYALTFCGEWDYRDRPNWLVDDFDYAWFYHQKRNKHHWQYWVSIGNENNENFFKMFKMPDKYREEMLADFYAFEKRSGKNTREMYLSKKDNMMLNPETREWLENQLSNKTS